MPIGPKDDDELRSFVEKNFYTTPDEYSKKVRAVPLFIKKVLDRFNQAFNHGRSSHQALPERVKKATNEVDSILQRLNGLRRKFLSGNDAEDPLVIEVVVNPLYKEGMRVWQRLQNKSIKEQNLALSQYNAWIERYYLWVEKYYNENKQDFLNALKEQMIQEVQVRVDKDLKIIGDYIDQQIKKVDLTNTQKLNLLGKIKKNIESITLSLRSLSTPPKNLKVEEIQRWQKDMDQKRQKVFDEALAQVDAIIEDETPFQHSQEDHSHIVDVLEKITYLESAVKTISRESAKEGISKTHIIKRIKNLEEEAYHTSIDLRLTQELFDRIQDIQNALSEISREIGGE